MAVKRETLRELAKVRAMVVAITDDADDVIVSAWARAWRIALGEWEAAAVALAAQRVEGRWPSPGVIAREEKAARALAVTRALLNDLTGTVRATVVPAAEKAMQVALDARPELVGSQMPPSKRAQVVQSLGPVDGGQVHGIVSRTTEQITQVLWPLSAEATAAVNDQLVRGVLLGLNPRDAARAMVAQVEGAFNGGLTRALVIARTEILDAHRAGGTAWDRANSKVVTGWQWIAQLDKRTCPSCWAQHGSKHSADEPGPEDHQQGRCDRLPLTKSWADLGFDIPERPSVVRDGQAIFNDLDPAAQLAVMGPQRLQLLRSGDVRWDQLSQVRQNPSWRPSRVPTPVRDLLGVPA